MKNFVFSGKHLMVDAIAEDHSVLATAELGGDLLEAIVERIDMTMILPPVTVKFPHNVCELNRILKKLENEGLADSKTAKSIAKDLELRKKESYGYSSFVMIAESHITIHTFPELGYFSFDCYSCKDFDEIVVLNTIRDFIATNLEVAQICGRFPPSIQDNSIEMKPFMANRKIITRKTK